MHKFVHKPILVCCLLSVILWMLALGIDILSGDRIWITRNEVNQLEKEGRIEGASRLGNEFTIYFTQTINLRRGNNTYAVDSVFVKAVDISDDLKIHWYDQGRLIEQKGNMEYMGGDWVIVLCFLVGISFAVHGAFRNAREGSPRYKVRELEKKYRNGELNDEEFKRQIDDLSPYL